MASDLDQQDIFSREYNEPPTFEGKLEDTSTDLVVKRLHATFYKWGYLLGFDGGMNDRKNENEVEVTTKIIKKGPVNVTFPPNVSMSVWTRVNEKPGDLLGAIHLNHYVTSAVHMRVLIVVHEDPDRHPVARTFFDRLKEWVKRYYGADLVEIGTTPEDVKQLARAIREGKKTGPKDDGANIWLEYVLTIKGKKPGSNPDGNEVFELWRTLLDFEKPDDQLKEDDDRAWERYRSAVDRIRKRSELFGAIK